ncbi:MAG: WYL domain-containing transcriptional regulator [Actinomycetaceae bacterium]|nr:WYL domain-containing transcriptional regulator [Actinomycetaceae bacterium]
MAKSDDRKLVALEIVNYLLERTDSTHGVTSQAIAEDLGITDKTVRENLRALRNRGVLFLFGVEVKQFQDLPKADRPQGERSKNWFAKPVLDNTQARLFADALQLTRFDPDDVEEAHEILASLSGNVTQDDGDLLLPTRDPLPAGMYRHITVLDEAIRARCAVRFNYASFTSDGSLRNRWKEAQQFFPYAMAFKNGRYYALLGRQPQPSLDNFSPYLIERMREVELVADSVPSKDESDERVDFAAYVNERPYMYIGDAIDVTYRVQGGLDGTFDWFTNPQVTVIDAEKDIYEVTVRAEPQAMVWWALQYASDVEVIAPASLREMIREELATSLEKYTQDNP